LYLTNLATKYLQLAVLSMQAILGPHKLLDDITSLLIAPSVIVRAIVFKTDMARYGHTYIFSGGSAGKLSVHGSTVPEQARKRYLKFQLTVNYRLRRKEMDLRSAESMIILTLPSESLKRPNDDDIEP
jgi:hypothetical protein